MVKMEQEDANIRSLPLSFIPTLTKETISDLLNSIKVLPADGPQKLARDWRGLADLVGIPSETQASIRNSQNPTGRVLDHWMRDPSVNVGDLLDHLEKLDRFDVYDDVCESLSEYVSRKEERIVNHGIGLPHDQNDDDIEREILTYDDRLGQNCYYDAYVLYAKEDQAFVDELINYLHPRGFMICTRHNLLAGQIEFRSLTKLIAERCYRIILVYSPEFLDSPAESFFRDFAQAISIDSRKNKIIPLMYRDCNLPSHLAVYHNLRYGSGMYNFWQKLALTLNISRLPPRSRLIPGHGSREPPSIQISQAHSAVNIVEVSADQSQDCWNLGVEEDQLTQRSVSVENFDDSSPEDSVTSDHSDVKDREKKPSKVKTFLRKITRRKRSNRTAEEIAGS